MIYDLVIIGAGQAGLSAAYYAKRRGIKFVIIDTNRRVGDNWRQRYDVLELFSTRRHSGLPGLRFPGQRDGYPTKNQAADYLEQYSRHWQFPLQLGVGVKKITKQTDHFTINTLSGNCLAKAVIVAVGGFQSAFIPQLPGRLTSKVIQLHSSLYHNPHQLPNGLVLVVGSGNSGAAIATNLASSHQVELSARSRLRFYDRHGWQKAIPYIGRAIGVTRARHTSLVGSRIRNFGIPIIGIELKHLLSLGAIKLRPEIARLDGRTVNFVDGSSGKYSAIIWCTGFKSDMRWIQIPNAIDASGSPIHHFGISPVPGLYYLGLHWQRSLGSALMGEVGRDAKFIIRQLVKQQKQSTMQR